MYLLTTTYVRTYFHYDKLHRGHEKVDENCYLRIDFETET
jgi:hypothetical protein